ncbi:MAG: EamA family transporter [Reyranella sp.]|nr:EamA family transporter [Reyranella sp.]
MAPEVFLLVLCAAVVHAAWNALVKVDGDRLALLKAMSLTQLFLSLCLIPFVAVPAIESWPYLIASPTLATAYMLFLNRAYHAGDLSHVYPLARGVAPLGVAVVSIGLLGERLEPAAQIGVLLIALGIASLVLARGAAGLHDPRSSFYALGAGLFIAAYTLTDGLGARAAGTASGFMAWMALFNAILVVGCIQWLQRGKQRPVAARSGRIGIAVGLMSYGATWLAIWAMTVAPLALVSALRETSVVFAVVIGVVFLKERLSLIRLVSVATTLIGTALLKFSR